MPVLDECARAAQGDTESDRATRRLVTHGVTTGAPAADSAGERRKKSTAQDHEAFEYRKPTLMRCTLVDLPAAAVGQLHYRRRVSERATYDAGAGHLVGLPSHLDYTVEGKT